MIRFELNGREVSVTAPADMPLLWVLRDMLGMTGTKYACGRALCGACAVQLDGQAVRSCVLPVEAAEGRRVTTIEGLAVEEDLAPVQQAWVDEQVPQCGYCQSGVIVAVDALLASNPAPTDADIDAAITNICRCGTYPRMRRAVHAAARLRREPVK